MSSVFDSLPGLDAPVGGIAQSLGQMWTETAAAGKPAPPSEDATATQVNFVLHLGINVTVEDAQDQFQTLLRFSRRYPSRAVVLCPAPDDHGTAEIRAKVYGECFLGKSKDDTRCCEFVILSYSHGIREFLENQVSICLSSDLPLYYWAHRFSASSRLAAYPYLLTRARRVLIDSAIAPPDALAYPWPRPEAMRDLARARLLHVRQSVGQFLSRYPTDVLAGGLRTVSLSHGPPYAAEARVLLGWVKERIDRCGPNQAEARCAPLPAGAPGSFALSFAYDGPKFFSWKADLEQKHALFEADFGSGRTQLPAAVSLLSPENALSEAMFF